MTDQTLPAAAADAPSRRRLPTRPALAVTAGLAAIALGVSGIVLTTAAFTDSETVTGNTVGTAKLSIGDVIGAQLSATDLLPGYQDTFSDAVTFSNDGTVDFGYTVTLTGIAGSSADPAVNTALLGWVPITIASGGRQATGTLGQPPVLSGIVLPVGQTADVDVTIGLSTAADNTVQDLTASFDLVVRADQIP